VCGKVENFVDIVGYGIGGGVLRCIKQWSEL
jgi:hypothetical protein